MAVAAYNHCFGAAEGYTFIITSDNSLQDIEPFIETYLGGLPTGESCMEYVHKGGKIPVEPLFLAAKPRFTQGCCFFDISAR